MPTLTVIGPNGPVASGGSDASAGTYPLGSVVYWPYTVRNDGTGTATLGTVAVTPGATIASDPSGLTIAAGASRVLSLLLSTGDADDFVSTGVTIPSDDPAGPYHFDFGFAVDGVAVVSAFTTRAAARSFAGPYNLDAYAGKQGTNTDDATLSAAYAQAGGDTDADLRNAWRTRLRDAGVDYTSLESLLTNNPDEARWLAETANWGIVFRLYQGRGTFDNGPSGDDLLALDGKMSGLRKRYEQRLADVRSGVALRDMQKAAGVVGILEAQASLAPTAGPADGDFARDPFAGIRWCL